MNSVVKRVLISTVAGASLLMAGAVVSPVAASPAQLEKAASAVFLRSMSSLPGKALEGMPGLDEERISRILEFRKSRAHFVSVEQFQSVTGLSDEQLEALTARFRNLIPDESGAPELPRPSPGTPGKRSTDGPQGGPGSRKAALGAHKAESPEGEGQGLGISVVSNYYSILPGYDLGDLTEPQRQSFLERINRELCPCGCENETLGYCLVNDPGCPVVKARVRKVYEEVVGRPPKPPAGGAERQ
jgi:hypothetical protein